MTEVYTKNCYPIKVGDVLKVYHFTAALRRKKHYMYKQVVGKGNFAGDKTFLRVSHLDLTASEYSIAQNNQVLADYEIVQTCSFLEFENRERKKE